MMMAMGLTSGGGGGNTLYRGGAVLTLAGGNFTGTAPAGIVAGDVIYACFLTDTGTTTGPSGFANETTPVNTTTNAFPCTLMKKIAAGTEGGTTLTFPSGGTNGQGVLVVIGGANATQPDVSTPVGSKGTTATITYPSITTATANAMHVVFACNFNAVAGTPAGYTARQASAAWVACFTKVIASASTVSGVTSTNGGDWVSFSAAVRSA